jgi:hypothetical protein
LNENRQPSQGGGHTKEREKEMGISINHTVAAALKDGIDFVAESENKCLKQLPVAVRTEKGIDERFYLDIEDGKLLITPESFYKTQTKEDAK